MSPEVSGLPKAAPPVSFFSFDRVGISRFSMQEAEPPIAASETGLTDEVGLELTAAIAVHAPNRADVTLSLKINPGPGTKPYAIAMDLVGSFSAQGDIAPPALIRFCQTNAPAIMFPYARQAINEITSNGRFGPLRLPLLNLQAVLATSAWTETPHLQAQS
jgi:preprotein translocase subunit SecB